MEDVVVFDSGSRVYEFVFAGMSVAFAALCVWLVVRIVNRRERWAKWIAGGLIVAVPFLYVVSIGPVCWWADYYQRYEDEQPLRRVYWPLRKTLGRCPKPVEDGVWWWAGLGCRYTTWDFLCLAWGSDD